MLSNKDIRDLVQGYGTKVNEGSSIREIIKNGDLPRLNGVTILEGKVSDSVFGDDLKTKDNLQIRLMYRNNKISTHDKNRGLIPFKDQVLALNHDYMLNLVKDTIGTAQFDIENLNPTSTVIASQNLNLFKLENVLRAYMAKSSTSTSLYSHWKKAKEQNLEKFMYAGYTMITNELKPNKLLPFLMDTPSTKDENDQTVDPSYLFEKKICTLYEYRQIIDSSIKAFCLVNDYLKSKNMVLVDTKTEHGKNNLGQIVSADELYTMDSSRFWRLNDDGTIMLNENNDPVSFSKEFARGMVKSENQLFTKEQTNEIAVRYIEGLQYLTRKEFKPDLRPRDERIINSTNLILNYLL